MEKIEIKNNSGKIQARIFSFLDLSRNSKEKIVEEIIEEIPYLDSCGYAGYLTKDGLKECLNSFICPKEKKGELKVTSEEIISEIRESIKKLSGVIGNDSLDFFIFPTFDPFVKNEMVGNSGFTPWKNTIHLYVNSFKKNKIAYTVAHEIAHALSPYPIKEDDAIGAILLYEGIAEKFREFFLGEEKSPWVKAISSKKANEFLKNLDLKKRDYKLYKELFFGSKKYPLWTGYTIGYKMAEEYLKNIKEKKWSVIVRKDMEKELIKVKIN